MKSGSVKRTSELFCENMGMIYLDHLDETCELCHTLLSEHNDSLSVIKEVMRTLKEKADYVFVKAFVDEWMRIEIQRREEVEKILIDMGFGC